MNLFKKELPRVIYVSKEKDGDSVWFIAEANGFAFDDGARVGIYDLREIKTKKVTITEELI
jgi:hypothetical protein